MFWGFDFGGSSNKGRGGWLGGLRLGVEKFWEGGSNRDGGCRKGEVKGRARTYGDGKSKWCMVYAKALDITWSGDTRYWRWAKETSGDDFEAAELLNVCWLEVRGKLATTDLSPGTLYEVVFVVKMKTEADGWDAPVNFKFTPPDGAVTRNTTFKLMEILKDSKDEWKDIPFGEFKAPENPRNIEFSLYEYSRIWKSGLVIKGVAVRPKS
ncbi:phloem protein 2-A1 [Prunus dulcis]|uniref:Phloem protein 2-A1 n=1 Tax=Prunus dulcis TaxID=3755 RepID=A0A5H2XQI9_PRUDU|nr:phloem protein 2-A1 [Prunus dulcis]